MRLLGYTRVSTDEQAASGNGLAAQRRSLEDAARYRGWTLERIVSDEGVSAKSLDRPELIAALQSIRMGEADGLAVSKLDRLTRSVIDFALLVEWFGQQNATLVVLDLQVDTSTPSGRVMANVMASFAQFERELIAQRTREGLAQVRAQGRAISRPTIPAEVVQQIRDLRDCGLSYQAICDELNRRGVPTARGAKRWTRSSVQSALGYRRQSRRRVVSLPGG